MNSRYSLRALFLLGLSAILTVQILAQAPNDKTILKGKVLDPNHASIEGADVWISKAGLPSSTAVTDRNGEFSLALAPGEYQVRIAAGLSSNGFEPRVIYKRAQDVADDVIGRDPRPSRSHHGTCRNRPLCSPVAAKTTRSYGSCTSSKARSSAVS